MCEDRVSCSRLGLGYGSEAGDDENPGSDFGLHIFLGVLTGLYGGIKVGPAIWCDVEPM